MYLCLPYGGACRPCGPPIRQHFYSFRCHSINGFSEKFQTSRLRRQQLWVAQRPLPPGTHELKIRVPPTYPHTLPGPPLTSQPANFHPIKADSSFLGSPPSDGLAGSLCSVTRLLLGKMQHTLRLTPREKSHGRPKSSLTNHECSRGYLQEYR